MSRVQSPDTSFQLDEGTALQRLQNGLELGLSISKSTASARSAEILEAINKMELTFPMLTSEGAEGRVETLVNTILQAVGGLPVGRRKSSGWLKESLRRVFVPYDPISDTIWDHAEASPPSDERREQPYEYSPVSDDDEDVDVDVEEEVPNLEMKECYDNNDFYHDDALR